MGSLLAPLTIYRFLWVNLQLENLCKVSEAKKDRVVEQALDKLPRGLEKTYLRILDQISSQDEYPRSLSLHCLMWVLYAKKPLEVRELRHAIAALALVALDKTSQTLADLKSDLDDIDVILNACGNLIMAEGPTWGDKDNDSRRIRPIHYSVQEFFTDQSKAALNGDYLQSLRDADDAHAKLAGACLSYLTLAVSPPQPCEDYEELNDRVQNAVFGQYAATSFDYHISDCVHIPPDLIQVLKGFLDTPGLFLAGVVQLRSLKDKEYMFLEDFDPVSFQVSSSTIIHITSLYSVPEIYADIGTISLSPYVLHQACKSGDSKVVSRLVDVSCDLNELDTEGNTPVYYASERGHLEVVTLLLSRGADPSSQGRFYGSALQAAVVIGEKDIVALLLLKGADVNLQGGEYGSALQAAILKGEEDIVDLLLSKGPDVNVLGGLFGSALQAAVYKEEKDIIEVLLLKEADVNLQGGEFGSALQAAVYKGEKDIIELLLSKGADVNLRGGYSGSALQAAAAVGGHNSEDIVKTLLSYRANVNVEGGNYGSALLAASANGEQELVRILLDGGADVNARVGKHGSALQAASYGEGIVNWSGQTQKRVKAQLNTISLLLDNGADVDARGGDYGNALQAAISGCRLWRSRKDDEEYQDITREARRDIVDLLLKRGANVTTSGKWRNGVQAAKQQGRPELVDLLIAYGAEVRSSVQPT